MNTTNNIGNYFEQVKATLETSCEDSNTVYINVGDIRLIFKNGQYFGWYTP